MMRSADQRVVIGQRHDTGAKADEFGALGGNRDEQFRRADGLEPGGVVLADPGFVIAQPVQPLHQL